MVASGSRCDAAAMNFTTGIRLTSTLALLAYAITVAPASALATNRYVGVGGSTTDPSCTDPAHPCELDHAVSQVADAGDDVTVGPGHYELPQAVSVDQPMTIHGQADAPRPTLTLGGLNDAPNAGQPVLRYLELDLSSAHMFFGRGVAEQLVVVGGSGACARSQGRSCSVTTSASRTRAARRRRRDQRRQ